MAKESDKSSWENIGRIIGKKIETELKDKEHGPWKHWSCHTARDGQGFLGRALFIIGVLLFLNALGIMGSVSVWIQILIAVGFALLRF